MVQDAQLLERRRTAGCVSFGQNWKTGTGRQYFTDIVGLSSTTVTKSVCKAIKFSGKNAKQGLLRRSRSFKVIEVGTNRKPVDDFLLVINSK